MKRLSIIALAFATLLVSCGKETPVGENLLKNGGFEDIKDGMPRHWKIKNFRGLGDAEAAYRINDRQVYEGQYSFNFVAEENTKRFYMLSQEIEVRGVKTIRVRARIKTVGVDMNQGQYPQAGVALTFYNEFRGRFSSERFADVRTEPLTGSSDGFVQVEGVYRLPEEIAFVEVHCVLGMAGRIWFDDVVVDVPETLPWNQSEGEYFTHYWLDERPYPDGSREYQEGLYTQYANRLGIPREDRERISYYLYPDTTALRAIGVSDDIKVDYPRREIHSVNPADDHEIIHLLTEVYGTLPTALAEGTVFYFHDEVFGKPVQPQAKALLEAGKLPSLEELVEPLSLTTIDPHISAPAAASFVGYIFEYGGTERFLELHRNCIQYMSYVSFKEAFEDVYGPLEEAERDWHSKLASANFSKPPQ